MLIGIIDSGNGGYEFLKGIIDGNDYILIMDKAYFPYGIKSKEFLIKRTLYLVLYLKNRGCNKIILACNTLSIMVLDFIKLIFNNVSGVIELLDNSYDNGLFIASRNTIKYIKDKIEGITALDGQYLINKIENNSLLINDIEKLKGISSRYNILILGCTHFIALKKYLYDINYVSQDELYKKKNSN